MRTRAFCSDRRWIGEAAQLLKCMCTIIFAINNIVLYPRAVPKHHSTNSRLVADLLTLIEKYRIETFGFVQISDKIDKPK